MADAATTGRTFKQAVGHHLRVVVAVPSTRNTISNFPTRSASNWLIVNSLTITHRWMAAHRMMVAAHSTLN